MPKVLFLTTAHRYNDDRIFHHQAKELVRQGFTVKICSLSSEFQGLLEGISIESFDILGDYTEKKIKTFRNVINTFKPDIIIASEPLAVIAGKNFIKKNKCSLIYDITEWYPSMRMLSPFRFPFKVFHFIRFFLIQIYAGFLSTHFIFGEKTKKFPLAQLFPFKSQIVVPYFPDQRYIVPVVNKIKQNSVTLCYTGVFSKEKGLDNFLNVAKVLEKKRSDLHINLLLIGSPPNNETSETFTELMAGYNFKNITIKKPSKFEDFARSFAEADICFDLRANSFENNRCLPIKLFYYAAAGKPVVYTDLKAIRNHVDILKFGHLVNPENLDEIAVIIERYLDDPKLYDGHATNAVQAYEKYYNWGLISDLFVNFVKKTITKK